MPIRSIRWEHGTDEQIQKLGLGFRRLDDLMIAMEETLCRHPEMFPVLPGTKIRLCKTNEFAGSSFDDVPRLALYFYYDDEIVYVIFVEGNSLESYGTTTHEQS